MISKLDCFSRHENSVVDILLYSCMCHTDLVLSLIRIRGRFNGRWVFLSFMVSEKYKYCKEIYSKLKRTVECFKVSTSKYASTICYFKSTQKALCFIYIYCANLSERASRVETQDTFLFAQMNIFCSIYKVWVCALDGPAARSLMWLKNNAHK